MARLVSASRVLLVGAALFAGLSMAARPCLADDDAGITVTGIGTAKAKPTMAVMNASISGDAELAADANVKYGDGKKKAVAAINALQNPDLSIEFQGAGIDQAMDPTAQMRMMQGMASPDNGKQKVEVAEELQLTLKNIDKVDPDKLVATIVKTIDACRDAGLQVGPPTPKTFMERQMAAQGGSGSLVMFKLGDKSQAEHDAYKNAVDDARQKAQMIADLSGVKLGNVLSVSESAPATQSNLAAMIYGMETGSQSDDKSLETAALTEIPVTVNITVKFQIVGADGK